jgi:hypothetical protein
MSDFRFNFESSDEVLTACSQKPTDDIVTSVEECKEMAVTTRHSYGRMEREIVLCGGAIRLKHTDLNAAEAEVKVHSTNLKLALERHSDLVPNVYEGIVYSKVVSKKKYTPI